MSEVGAQVSAGMAVLHVRKQQNSPDNGWVTCAAALGLPYGTVREGSGAGRPPPLSSTW